MSNGLPDWCIAHDQPWGHLTEDTTRDGHCELGMRPDRLLTRVGE